ncbi:hypothetical protein GGTG_05965 [Gaeumannomyces tritici R3-111a-1]|uniref:Uncharacterized protein n=1 Tax=Gaeumannomyces tritici (strain R3-111a-1) TaxID=644352 RepID=J3NXF9_GAET3|nr:hypothetical protein GGTG_05965 [Gaeumannomyces tritici R3-111a-1]EJT76041.1 hypothetical protein GGTG_05965 [Gaeumannomyces tritici R3-111a-1]
MQAENSQESKRSRPKRSQCLARTDRGSLPVSPQSLPAGMDLCFVTARVRPTHHKVTPALSALSFRCEPATNHHTPHTPDDTATVCSAVYSATVASLPQAGEGAWVQRRQITVLDGTLNATNRF